MAENEAEGEPTSESAEEGGEEEHEDEEEESEEKKKKKKKKKGNWKNIGTTPRTYVAYPCECRWKLRFPKDPCIKYKQIRWVNVPMSKRLKEMAQPLLRRLLTLWVEFGHKLPPKKRERLKALLTEKYGLSPEFLEQIADEAKIAREEASKKKRRKGETESEGGSSGRKKKGKGKGKRRGKKGKAKKKKKKKKKGKGKKKKGKKGKKKKGKKKKDKKKKKGKKKGKGDKGTKGEKKEKKEREPAEKIKEGTQIYKKRKGGKLPLNWPHKMGSKFILSCISYLSQDPDEDFNSRATEYFDVQAMAILEQVCRFLDMPLPDPERPTQYGETLVIMALNLTDWIAKFVVAPSQEIPDEMIEKWLDLRGKKPKITKNKKKGKKGKHATPPRTAKADDSLEDIQRVWDELKSPTYVPPKTRVSKRKAGEETDEEGYATEVEEVRPDDQGGEEGAARWRPQTVADIKKEFLEYLIWYDPWTPQFMYLGPKVTPKGIDLYNIRHPESDEVPDDLRILNWNLIKFGYTDGYSLIPSPVPQYYPSLRPLRPVRLEDLEQSGIPKEVIKQNLRFFSPWYIMSVPLKPPMAPPTEEEEQFVGEGEELEERFEDKMLEPSGPKPVKDSLWGDGKMREQLEILVHLFHLAASVPNLTIEYVFELLEEFCDAVECAEEEENPSEANRRNIQKRTIILERYYYKFFGKKFRDYNERTQHYMRVICSRLAYYIQLLFEYTARTLWELQSEPNQPLLDETPSDTPDDPQSIQDWEAWIEWLLRVTRTCDEWAGWISETVEEAERKAAKKKGEYIGPDGRIQKLTKREWFSWKDQVQDKIHDFRSIKKVYNKEAAYFAEKAETLQPVRHRPIKKKEEEEVDEGEWEDMTESEDESQELYKKSQLSYTEETSAGETEYEDLPEDP